MYNTDWTLATLDDDVLPTLYKGVNSTGDTETLIESFYTTERDSVPSDETMASRNSVASEILAMDANDNSLENANAITSDGTRSRDRNSFRGVIERMVVGFNGMHKRFCIS
ncbi:unnamed protein product [Umbelopsis sp. WA50703]